MFSRNTRIIVVLIAVVSASVGALAQTHEVDSLFYRGVDAYEEGRYTEALRLMELLDRAYSGHRRSTGSLLMQGKSLYKLGEYRQSLKAFERLISDYPMSNYIDDAFYGAGTVHYRMAHYAEAVINLMTIVDMNGDPNLQRKGARLASEIMDTYVEDEELRQLLESVAGERGNAAITMRLAHRELDEERYQSARQILQGYLDIYPQSPYAAQVVQLMARAEELGLGSIKVGVILPLTGDLAEQGDGLLAGIQYAVRLQNESGGVKIELIVRDSNSDVVQAVIAAQELCHDKEILAIIGEVQSDITAAVAAVAAENSIPLLAPTALGIGITSIGPSVFQVNGSLYSRGRMLAEYAVQGLGLDRFAILSPADAYGKAMKDAFAETVIALGGEVCSEKWYFEGDQDLGQQFKGIREDGIRQMLEDSLIVIVSKDVFEERYEEQPVRGDTVFVSSDIQALVDSTDLRVTTFDGFFLPVYGEDLPYIMPQFAYYNIDARIFGGDYWHDIEALEDHQRYIDGVIFLTDYYIDPSNFKYFRFRDAFRIAMQRTPEKMEVIGYDTASLLLEVVSERALPREGVGIGLAGIQGYNGVRGLYSFNEERVNPNIRLLQFRGGNILQIK